MGIKSLNKFLKDVCPEIYETIHISELAFKKVAIDISLYLCKFKVACGDKWLGAFINLVSSLRNNEIHCVIIYDSGAPPEKMDERAKRLAHREKLEEKIFILEEAISHYYETNEVNSILADLHTELQNKSKTSPRRLLSNKKSFDIKSIEQEVSRRQNQIIIHTPEDFEITKKLFDILKVPYFQAPMEAETMCSHLCKRGLVDAVLSEDTDVLAYGAPMFLSKIDIFTQTCVVVNHDQMLESLELNYNEFLDLCIMCGTDYNKNIPGVGPKNAYKYIQKYRDISEIGKNTNLDTSILNHERGRELFKDYDKTEVHIPYCGSPDFDELVNFVQLHDIKVNLEQLRKSFIHNVLVFEEEEEMFEEIREN